MLVGLEDVLIQVLQPYFYYSVVFMAISFVCVKLLVRYSHFMSRTVKSLVYFIPLLVPLFTMLAFMPAATIFETPLMHSPSAALTVAPAAGSSVSAHILVGPGSPLPQMSFFGPQIAQVAPVLPRLGPIYFSSFNVGVGVLAKAAPEILSITGIICITGLVLGAVFAASMSLFGGRIAARVLRVIELSPEEYPWLQAKVSEISKKLNVDQPKVGVVEDLRPNAFTLGCGHRTMLVFSIGLLDILSREEMVAVASHELAHVRNRDFFFKVISNALTAVSFFNPVAYIASSAAQREREMLADEQGASVLAKPSVLGTSIAKIHKSLMMLPKESVLVRMTSNLFVTSSIMHRPQILAAHPRVDQRLGNLSSMSTSTHTRSTRKSFALLLSLLIVVGGFIACYATISFRAAYASPTQVAVNGFGVPGNAVTVGYLGQNFTGPQHGFVTYQAPQPFQMGAVAGAGQTVIAGQNGSALVVSGMVPSTVSASEPTFTQMVEPYP